MNAKLMNNSALF